MVRRVQNPGSGIMYRQAILDYRIHPGVGRSIAPDRDGFYRYCHGRRNPANGFRLRSLLASAFAYRPFDKTVIRAAVMASFKDSTLTREIDGFRAISTRL